MQTSLHGIAESATRFKTKRFRSLYSFLNHITFERALIRLIQKWLRAGIVHPDGVVEHPEKGTAQGSIISPVLSNIYLHFVLDQWFEKKVKSQCTGKAILIRYADDFVAAFRYHKDAANFMRMLKERFSRFGLEVAKDKTRKLRFDGLYLVTEKISFAYGLHERSSGKSILNSSGKPSGWLRMMVKAAEP
jgi:retron-type reverse transcriptase